MHPCNALKWELEKERSGLQLPILFDMKRHLIPQSQAKKTLHLRWTMTSTRILSLFPFDSLEIRTSRSGERRWKVALLSKPKICQMMIMFETDTWEVKEKKMPPATEPFGELNLQWLTTSHSYTRAMDDGHLLRLQHDFRARKELNQ